MPLTADQAVSTAAHLRKMLTSERQTRLDRIHEYLRNKVCNVYVPRSASQEYRQLVDQARVPVLPLVVTEIAQNLFVEGYRPARKSENAAVWDIWQANRMDARQASIYRAALSYGYAYATALPGRPRGAPATARPSTATIRPYSPRRMIAVYDDPVNDEWPEFALAVSTGLESGQQVVRLRVYDDTSVYELVGSMDGGTPVLRSTSQHELGVCPVVRWLNEYGDVDDGSQGEVEQLIPLQDQLSNITFGLLMAVQYAAFKQKWVTGEQVDEDENGVPRESYNPAVNRMFKAESEGARFGEFSETNLDGYLNSRDSTLRLVSSLAQIPPHVLASSGAVANLSADALAAIEAGLQRKVADRKTSFGESTEQLLRLAGLAAGNREAWEDTSSQVVWRDTESRSLAQVADALGKIAQMLGVPVQALWERIPGVTQQDLERWKALAAEQDAVAALERLVNGPPERQQGAGTGRQPALAGAPG